MPFRANVLTLELIDGKIPPSGDKKYYNIRNNTRQNKLPRVSINRLSSSKRAQQSR
jgi:hypothetical protein